MNELKAIHGIQRNIRQNKNINLEENFKSLQQFKPSNAINSNKKYRRDSLDSSESNSVVHHKTDEDLHSLKSVSHHENDPDQDLSYVPNPSSVANITSPQTDAETVHLSREPSKNPPVWSRCSTLVQVSETLNDEVEPTANYISCTDRRIDTSSSSAVFYDSLDNVNHDGLLVNSVNSSDTFMSERGSLHFIKNPSNDTFSISSNSAISVNDADQMHRRYLNSLGFISAEASGRLNSILTDLHRWLQ